MIGTIDIGVFLILLNLVVHGLAMYPFDVSQTVAFLGVLALFVGFSSLLFAAGYSFVQAYRCLASVGLDDRYVFQHRDDEVEL